MERANCLGLTEKSTKARELLQQVEARLTPQARKSWR